MFRRLFNKFRGLNKVGLRKKIIVGYIMIIVIPSAFLGAVIYKQFYGNMINGYVKQKQQIVYDYYYIMGQNLSRVQDVNRMFQYNTELMDYMDGEYISDMYNIYLFSKYIKQVLGYVHSSIPNLKSINIYKNNDRVRPISSVVFDINMMQNAKLIRSKTTAGRGAWIYTSTSNNRLPSIKYYERIYNNDFSKELGFLEIIPSSDVMINYFNDLNSISNGNDGIYLVNMKNEVLYRKGKDILHAARSISNKLLQNNVSGRFFMKVDGRNVIVNEVYIKELNLKTIVVENESDAIKYMKFNKNTLFLYMLVLFSVLSVIYYFITTNLTTRIVKLAKHMRNVDERNISLFRGKKGNDEIGVLIDSYNSMITRIDELINTVHKSELLRKEAAYAALQAQIRPHFLFGTLEMIRMLAESNNDLEVSNIIYTFGRLMRYSLSSTKNEVSLKDEIENITSYLEIQKMRMGERLQYEFHIEYDIDNFLCPRFILQPLVENSIVHGISKCRGCGVINISVTEDKEYVIILIYDNGYGIPPEKLSLIHDVLDNKIDIKDFQTDRSGFGVYNVSERVKTYYGKNSRLAISSKLNTGTRCILYLHKGDAVDENNDC